MLPLLLPIVSTLAPDMLSWLFGPKAEATAAKVATVVQAVTGADVSTADGAAAVTSMLATKPDLAIQLQQQLATLKAQMQAEADREADAARQADLDALRAQLADLASARGQTVDLAKAGSAIAWAAPVLSIILLIAFAVMLYVVLTQTIPPAQRDEALLMLGALATMAGQVPNYWLGSSSGSARKDLALATIRKQ